MIIILTYNDFDNLIIMKKFERRLIIYEKSRGLPNFTRTERGCRNFERFTADGIQIFST